MLVSSLSSPPSFGLVTELFKVTFALLPCSGSCWKQTHLTSSLEKVLFPTGLWRPQILCQPKRNRGTRSFFLKPLQESRNKFLFAAAATNQLLPMYYKCFLSYLRNNQLQSCFEQIYISHGKLLSHLLYSSSSFIVAVLYCGESVVQPTCPKKSSSPQFLSLQYPPLRIASFQSAPPLLCVECAADPFSPLG